MLQRQEREAEEVSQNGAPANKKASVPLPELEYKEKGKEGRSGGDSKKQQNSILPSSVDSKLQEVEYMEKHINNKRLTSELGSTENLLLKEDNNSSCSSSSSSSSKNYKNSNTNAANLNSSSCSHSATNGSVPSSAQPPPAGKNEKKHKITVGKGTSGGSHRDPTDNCIPNNELKKPEALVRLEQDIKKLKADLQASRQVEQDLRSQIGSLGSAERSIRTELGQLRQENELLQNKLHNAVQAKQKDKQTVGQLEKRLKTEQEARAAAEKQLTEEKKRKKLEEATVARAVALAAASRYVVFSVFLPVACYY
ncbi:Macoilin [Xenoophorus captivus]|uniref:Macoilin n=1 Tax=Xenoophorus captivus TaxID=1517983 RepID=A0ABV0QUJ5_9TELE